MTTTIAQSRIEASRSGSLPRLAVFERGDRSVAIDGKKGRFQITETTVESGGHRATVLEECRTLLRARCVAAATIDGVDIDQARYIEFDRASLLANRQGRLAALLPYLVATLLTVLAVAAGLVAQMQGLLPF